jgi:serine/threonine protein phosphatase PrpC
MLTLNMATNGSKQNVEDRGPKIEDREPKVTKSVDVDQRSILDSRSSIALNEVCPACSTPRTNSQEYCDGCGLVFASFVPATLVGPVARLDPSLLRGRYRLGDLIHSRGSVSRYRGLDYAAGTPEPMPVVIVKGPAVDGNTRTTSGNRADSPPDDFSKEEEILPSFDDHLMQSATETIILPVQPPWPTVAWEQFFLQRVQQSCLPRILDSFSDDDCDYLVEESRSGRALWDAWDDATVTAKERFGWLQQLAVAMQQMHQYGVVLESLRPEMLAISAEGTVFFTDLSNFLALPLPAEPLIFATFSTAPELVLTPDQADARADLFGFGALLFALFMGRELAEMDFARPGVPKPFLPQFPDVHPLLGRLICKTFCADRDARLPTEEAIQDDPTGFKELTRLLEICRRNLDQARLDVAAWTTTGMVRTYNEDAFALWHGVSSQQDYHEESALVLLADGMGGSAAGEVAAALAIHSLKKSLLSNPMFVGLAGNAASLSSDSSDRVGTIPGAISDESQLDEFQRVECCEQLLVAALKEANTEIHNASQAGVGKRGMGCTAEVVYVSGRNLVIGHAGDCRTYHFHEGRLLQLTRDQTMVGRLVELGQLTPEEAAKHPRRSELQQALGGRPDVEPLAYHAVLKPGDWVIVCSDGLSNHVSAEEIKETLQSGATSAAMAARRLVNLANLHAAVDNVTVAVIRIC